MAERELAERIVDALFIPDEQREWAVEEVLRQLEARNETLVRS